MTPYFDENLVTLYVGDCRTVLAELPDASINCCVTSPPYWRLRDYGTATWEGGDEGCDHKDSEALAERMRQKKSMIAAGERIDGSTRTRAHDEELGQGIQYRTACKKCGAVRVDSQIGLEQTPDEYVAEMVKVFREVRRVLRDDGTLWLNIGDSFASGKGTCHNPGGNTSSFNVHLKANNVHPLDRGNKSTLAAVGLKPKDLVGIPWMVAFALRADGWYLRQDIIWHKPNPMPESVTDRCTKAHEYIFLLSKSERYHYDADAIRLEPSGISGGVTFGGIKKGKALIEQGIRITGRDATKEDRERYMMTGANRRSVWTVTTKPYSGAHFATFPEDLIEPCIKAGCPAGGSVLDPFFGAGTTGLVCQKHGVRCIGIELNQDYADICKKRLAQGVLFGQPVINK